jgi:hypothetical protein
MLGQKLGEFQGKVTGQRILPADGAHPKTETSFEISGILLGIDATMTGRTSPRRPVKNESY